jgi:hypothetical protein
LLSAAADRTLEDLPGLDVDNDKGVDRGRGLLNDDYLSGIKTLPLRTGV